MNLDNQFLTIKGSGVIALLITIATVSFGFGGWASSIQKDVTRLNSYQLKQEIINEKTQVRDNNMQILLMKSITSIEKANVATSKDIESIKENIQTILNK